MTTFLFDTNVAQLLIDPRAPKRCPKLLAEVESRVRQQGGLVISVVTLYELRRGIRALLLNGKGRSRQVRVEQLIRSADIVGVDSPPYETWDIAADVYARGRTRTPAVVIGDADLLIFATAARAGRTLVTTDRRLADNLDAIGHRSVVEVLETA